MPSVLITDADRGLGRELAGLYAAAGFAVLAAATGQDGGDWQGQNVTVLPYDPSDPAAAMRLAEQIGDMPLDIVIAHSADAPGLDRSVADIAAADWRAVMTEGPFSAAKLAIALRPNLERGAMKKLVAISSFSASIGGCLVDCSYKFRASRAALNSLWRTFAVEWRGLGICCLLLCADQGGGNRTTAELAPDLQKTIDQMTMESTGQFFNEATAKVDW